MYYFLSISPQLTADKKAPASDKTMDTASKILCGLLIATISKIAPTIKIITDKIAFKIGDIINPPC